MKQEEREKVIKSLICQMKASLTPEEYAHFASMDESRQRIFLNQYYRHHCNAFLNDNVKESYNVEGVVLLYARQMSVSAFAHNTLLYVQTIGHLRFPSTHFTTREGLNSYMLLETTAGSGNVTYGKDTVTVCPGDLIFLDCRQPHHYEAQKDGWEYRVVHCNGYCIANLYEKLAVGGKFFYKKEECQKIHSLLDSLFSTCETESSNQELICNSILTQILTEFLLLCPEKQDQVPEWISEVCQYLDTHFQPNVLQELEEHFYRSRYYICHAFKKAMGVSVLQYQIMSRLNVAKNLLIGTNLSLTEITVLIGYENENSFTRAFRKRYGITPGAFRSRRKL